MELIAAGKRGSLDRNDSIGSAPQLGSIGNRPSSFTYPEIKISNLPLDMVIEDSASSNMSSKR